MVHRSIVGFAGALFLILRMSDLSEPLAQGPGGTIGWLLFGCQLAIWVVVAVQRALALGETVPAQLRPGRPLIPCARLLDLTVTGSFGLLLWATMFAPWMFFVPLLLLHWLLVRHRTVRTAQMGTGHSAGTASPEGTPAFASHERHSPVLPTVLGCWLAVSAWSSCAPPLAAQVAMAGSVMLGLLVLLYSISRTREWRVAQP